MLRRDDSAISDVRHRVDVPGRPPVFPARAVWVQFLAGMLSRVSRELHGSEAVRKSGKIRT
jgi:hypothetical protein